MERIDRRQNQRHIPIPLLVIAALLLLARLLTSF